MAQNPAGSGPEMPAAEPEGGTGSGSAMGAGSHGSSRPGLIRALGRWDLTAVGVNQVIGSGIFVLPATIAALVGMAPSALRGRP